MEKDNLKIDIDMADFHGLSSADSNNPYKPPSSADLNPFLHSAQVKLGFWSYLATIIVVAWLLFANYVLVTILVKSGVGPTKFLVFTLFLTSILALSHLLIFFKVELARKIVVVHAYLLLLGVPVGTIAGIILLKALKGKQFAKNVAS